MYKNFEHLVSSLCTEGFVVDDHWFDLNDSKKLLALAQKKFDSGFFKKAKIGNKHNSQIKETIRGDEISWIDDWEESPELIAFQNFLERFQNCARESLFLPLKRFESHFAVYASGDGYAPHLDQHKDSKHRQISIVVYLNDVLPEQGGALILHNTLTQKKSFIKIHPKPGRMVMFLSSKIIHEVEPTLYPRWSITSWLRDDDLAPQVTT